ncbi:uncharacterized protein LOC120343137 [Styela clava]|uniref:uncharacterized protein LOC120343137 n=1 Tax=Styela clava TaxID=7725 RepID=UPI001939DC64|nr:uncharacterized protein LOC120343137 [Styela clava]
MHLICVRLIFIFGFFASYSISQEFNDEGCSVAFYPKTGCIGEERHIYLQFLNCSSSSATVSRAYFNWFRLTTRKGEMIRDDTDSSYPVMWKELIIPKYYRRKGYVTAYYRRSLRDYKNNAIQMVIPGCDNP